MDINGNYFSLGFLLASTVLVAINYCHFRTSDAVGTVPRPVAWPSATVLRTAFAEDHATNYIAELRVILQYVLASNDKDLKAFRPEVRDVGADVNIPDKPRPFPRNAVNELAANWSAPLRSTPTRTAWFEVAYSCNPTRKRGKN